MELTFPYLFIFFSKPKFFRDSFSHGCCSSCVLVAKVKAQNLELSAWEAVSWATWTVGCLVNHSSCQGELRPPSFQLTVVN